LEWTAIGADFQHAAIKRVLKSVIVAKSQFRIFEEINRDWRRVEMLVADHSRIINPSRIRR
jgi:hypothetical protein